MAIYLGILLFAFITASIAIVPYIDLLYRLRFLNRAPIHPATPLEDTEFSALSQKDQWKIGTPIGGGVLIIVLVSLLFYLLFPMLIKFGVYITSVFPRRPQLNVIFFTFISFGLVGLYDDLIKVFHLAPRSDWKIKTAFEIIFSLLSAYLIRTTLHVGMVYFPLLGILHLGWLYIPVAGAIIFFFCRAMDITDGMDGLSSGLLIICLMAFWAISVSILDTVLSTFIALWIGSLLAFLYFNIYPARIWLGNAGSLSFGATLAVTGLLLGKISVLFLIGGIFALEAFMHYSQRLSYLLFKRRLFPVTPLHYYLESQGWSEPKIVQRLWLVGIILDFVGLWLATA